MAYWIIKAGNANNSAYRDFQCDFLSDIAKLPLWNREGEHQENYSVGHHPCSPGSRCLCQEDGSIWLLGKDTNSWIRQKSSIGGNASEQNIESITNNQIESLFL